MRKICFFFLFLTNYGITYCQNLPLSYNQHYEYLRREQILGNIDSALSFNIRPISIDKSFPELNSAFLEDSISKLINSSSFIQTKSGKLILTVIPLQIISTYNSSIPDGWENGELVGAVGIQTLTSAGIHLKYGKLSLQLNPNYHYAKNKKFEEYSPEATRNYFRHLRRSVYYVDRPVRYGNNSISNFSLGNSHLGANLGGIFVGVSSENIWTGPGQFTSLVMSDNAPGFNHFRVQSTRPLKTFLGNFEGIYWAGQLKSSRLPYFSDSTFQEILGQKDESTWRYFTGISLSYNPKWIKGLSLGFSRGFQIYRTDMENTFKAFFPIFAPFQKQNEGLIESNRLRQDQNVSVFTRWIFPSIKTEFYFEYSRNDHPLNWRDLVLNPEHSRAFQIGFSKYQKLSNSYLFGFQGEITQTKFSINNIIRWPNFLGSSNSGLGSYDNFQVQHGWTNKGQVLGSNTGISGNSLIFKVGLFKDFKEMSIKFEHFENNPNFYEFANTAGLAVNPWIDKSLCLNYSNSFNKLFLKSSAGITQSLNYNFLDLNPEKNEFSKIDNRRSNFTLNLSLIYLL